MLSFHLIGSGSVASRCADLLRGAGHTLQSVISADPMLRRWAQARRIPLQDPALIYSVLQEHRCDYLLSIANWTLVDGACLKLVQGMAINYHDSLLPHYAGSHAAAWSLLDGANRHGISWHEMTDTVDGGKILLQRCVGLADGETTATLNAKYAQAAVESFAELLGRLEAGNHEGLAQDPRLRSYYRRSNKPIQATLLSPAQPARSVRDWIGAHDFGPSPNSLGRLRLWTGQDFLYAASCQLEPPGTSRCSGDRRLLQLADGAVSLELLDIYGRPLTGSEPLRIPEPPLEWIERLHSLTCKLQPMESYWINRLANLHELPGPELAQSSYQLQPADLPLVLAYLARRQGWAEFDLGYQPADQGWCEFRSLFAEVVPLRVRVDEFMTLADFSASLQQELESVEQKQTFLNDLASRHPGLRNRADEGYSLVLVTNPQAPARGKQLTLVLSDKAVAADLGPEFRHFAQAARAHPESPLVSLPPDSLGRTLRTPQRIRTASSSGWEETISQLWRSLLQVAEIGVEDSFFDFGGASMLTAQLCALLGQQLQVAVTPRDIMAAPTIAELARLLSSRPQDQGALPRLVSKPGGGPFPLCDIQQAYWVGRGRELVLGGVSCHVYQEYEIFDLDLERLNQAWNRLLQRHAMLRAVVHQDGTQEILEQVPDYVIQLHDVRGQDPDQALQPLRTRLSHQVLEGHRWPLFEIHASRTSPTAYRVHISFDALTMDSWSRELVFDEWRRLYDQPELTVEPLQVTFRDYVLTLPEVIRCSAYQRDRDYWWRHLDELPDGPGLPLAAEPASLTPPRFERRRFALSKEQWQSFQELCAIQGHSPNVVILAAFAEVMRAWSKNQDFTLNVTTFNRLPLHPQVNQVVGDFGSLLPVPIQNHSQKTFLGRVQQLAQALWQEQEHGLVSGVEVVRELSRRRGASPALVLPVVFTCLTRPAEARALGRLVYAITQTPQIWVDHWVYDDQDEGKAFVFDVVSGLFPQGLIASMMETYQRLLRDLTSQSQSWTRPWRQTFPGLPPAQRSRRSLVNATQHPFESARLQDLFDAQVALRPQHPAVVAEGRTLSYGELQSLARRWASLLVEHPAPLVAVLMEKGWEQVVAVLAVLYAGSAYLPLESDLPASRLEYLLDHGQVKVVLTQSWLEQELSWPPSVRRLALDRPPPGEGETACTTSQPGDLAYVIYTSGSTGLPKGVMIDHRGAVNTLLDINRRFEVQPQDRVLGLSSLSFDLSVYDIFGTLAAGATLVYPSQKCRRDPAHWMELVSRQGVTVWNSVPALMGLFLEQSQSQSGRDLPLRLVLLSGDWIPLTMPQRLQAVCPGARVISLGGATEGSIWSVFFPIDRVLPEWKSIPYGKPLANQRFRVLHQDLQDCPDWVVGDLFIEGSGVALGYWRDAERTAACFVVDADSGQRMYRTGDLGRYLPDGNLEILGREDSQVKIRGYRVELGEIEATLRTAPGVVEAVVVAVAAPAGGKSLQAYATWEAGQARTDLVEHLRQRLPAYMVPASVACLDSFPLSPNGKVDRQALAARSLPSNQIRFQASASGQGVERLLQLVRRLLNQELIQVDSNLLQLGATSIDVIRLLNHLEQEFGTRPTLDRIYADPTPAAIYQLCRSAEAVAPMAVEVAPRILDPEEQTRFKASQPGLRRDLESAQAVFLPGNPRAETFAHRRSHRRFALRPLELAAVGGWLAQLGQVLEHEKRRYRYGSAGSCYPVQVYLWFKAGRVATLSGAHYYDPEQHRLLPINLVGRLTREAYDRLVNRPLFEEAAFALFLVAQLKAIEPIYASRSRHFATLEAGLMTQVLEEAAQQYGLGVCQIGYGDFDSLPHLFQLGDGHWLVHSLLGGALDLPGQAGQDDEQRLLERIQNLSPEEVAALLEAESE